MTAHATKAVPVLKNGMSSFVLPCKRVTLRYCNWGGSSQGMRQFLKSQALKQVAGESPEIEFQVVKDSGHPIIRGEYNNGLEKVICVRNMDPETITEKIQLLKSSSGEKLKKLGNPVKSTNESVRGIWSPFHVDKEFRHRV